MASADLELMVIDEWLVEWANCLDLWLECGSDAPAPTAMARLRDWTERLPPAGFDPIRHAANKLLEPVMSRTERADALLELLVRQRANQRMAEIRSIANEPC